MYLSPNWMCPKFIEARIDWMISQKKGEWDKHLGKVLFGYRCGTKASTLKSPFYIFVWPTSEAYACLFGWICIGGRIYNGGGKWYSRGDEHEHVVVRRDLQVLENVAGAQAKKQIHYANRKAVNTYARFILGVTYIKLQAIRKKRALAQNWEGPYIFCDCVPS